MHDSVGQGLPDVRGEDMAALLSADHAPDIKTALDRVLSLNYSSSVFNNYI